MKAVDQEEEEQGDGKGEKGKVGKREEACRVWRKNKKRRVK